MRKAFFASFVAFLSLGTLGVPAYANHEGLYIVGQEKKISGPVYICLTETVAQEVHKAVTINFWDGKTLFDTFRLRGECATLEIATIKVEGQIGKDVHSQNGEPWRIVHAKLVGIEVGKDIYILTSGNGTRVISP